MALYWNIDGYLPVIIMLNVIFKSYHHYPVIVHTAISARITWFLQIIVNWSNSLNRKAFRSEAISREMLHIWCKQSLLIFLKFKYRIQIQGIWKRKFLIKTFHQSSANRTPFKLPGIEEHPSFWHTYIKQSKRFMPLIIMNMQCLPFDECICSFRSTFSNNELSIGTHYNV